MLDIKIVAGRNILGKYRVLCQMEMHTCLQYLKIYSDDKKNASENAGFTMTEYFEVLIKSIIYRQ